MALSAGTRLGPYEILAPLGAGGMGEVYRARDTRLDRTVAIKVLPSELSDSPKRRQRLEREARAISHLNHPHICTLHDVGREGEIDFLVMEHLEGESLADRLKRGSLPVDHVLHRATEIAEALHAAHGHGIVHRDLKPGNVMLTKSGAKLLDFGLAKLRDTDSDEGNEALSALPTEAPPLTDEGMIPGTYPYMAPEQLEGKDADARTDLFALGAVIYEMTTGKRAFSGDSRASLIAAIEKDEVPSLVLAQPATPAALDRLVQQCLKKDPQERFQSAHDVALRLREIAESGPEAEASRALGTPRWAIPALVAALLVGVLAGWLGLRPRANASEAPVVRSEIELTADKPLRSNRYNRPVCTELAVSPGGTLLVWASRPADDPTRSALHLRRLDSGEVNRISGTDGAGQPFFSPDGRWIGFAARGETTVLRKVPVDGGLVVDLAELSEWPMGLTWGPNGKIYLGSPSQGIRWVPAEGGPPREITTVDPAREAGHRLPSFLPGSRALLFTTMPVPFGVKARIESVYVATGERKVVVEDGADARYLPTGHLVFVRQGALMAARFDLQRLELAAPPIPVIDGVSQALNMGLTSLNSGAGQYAASDSGLLVYAPGGIHENIPMNLLLLDEAGRAKPLPGFDRPLLSAQVQFSPDGRQLAFVEAARSGLLWLFDIERQTYRALTNEGIAGSPRWDPDGTRLVLGWSEGGSLQLWVLPLDGGGWERLTEGERQAIAPAWSPDGRFLAFVRGGGQSADISLYRFEDRQVVPFLTTKASEVHPEFSPDGRWLAYASNESGQFEVYVTSFPDRKLTLTVSRQGGFAPAWSRDGRRLFYYSPQSPDGERSMMAVPVRHDPELSLGQPTALFRLPEGFSALIPIRSYDLHPDGRRFLVGVRKEQEPPPPITRLNVVHNWFGELNRLVPTD
jgi:Tol biopolymer transport system component